MGSSDRLGGVGIFPTENWVVNVSKGVRVCSRSIKQKCSLFHVTVTSILTYAPYIALTDDQKDHFYESLLQTTLTTKYNDIIFLACDIVSHE